LVRGDAVWASDAEAKALEAMRNVRMIGARISDLGCIES
jgi:hypothetical protein